MKSRPTPALGSSGFYYCPPPDGAGDTTIGVFMRGPIHVAVPDASPWTDPLLMRFEPVLASSDLNLQFDLERKR